MEEALQLQNVVKTFGPMRAVDDLELAVRRGETCAVVGPSGAGKTTTIRMILSILFPDSGRLSVLGKPSALEAKDRIGYLPEERGVYRRMKVGDFLLYMAQLKGVAPSVAQKRAARLLGRLGLEDVLAKKCEDLSKGMLQRVQFVASAINEPELLILDEPFSGLDPVSVRLLKQVINEERARGATLLFSTHVMSSAEELCDRVVMIHRGRKVLDEPTSALRRQFDLTRVEFEALDSTADLSALRTLPGVIDLDGRPRRHLRAAARTGHRSCDDHPRGGLDHRAGARGACTHHAGGRVHPARHRGRGRQRERGDASPAAPGPRHGRSRRMNLGKIGLIARREFVTTASRKGFLIGLIAMPVLMMTLVILLPRFLASRTPQVTGQVLVVDRSGATLDALSANLDPAAIAARRGRIAATQCRSGRLRLRAAGPGRSADSPDHGRGLRGLKPTCRP